MSTGELLPFVSIVVPCRDERRHIAACLESILATDYPADRFELLVADGMSGDGTRDLLAGYAARDPRVRVVDNPARTTPAALNAAIRQSRGDVVMRMDAHCHYPRHYVPALVAWLERAGADNVGGVCHTRPSGPSSRARAVAAAMSHPFGVGNAYFRIGSDRERWVDTVPFGCWRRDVFERIGLFDEELARNQDDEFNHRLISNGGRILLVPDVASEYFARDSLGALARTFHQYGYFKPLVARKLGRVVTARQLVPPLFVLGLAVAPVVAALSTVGALAVLLLGAAYACAAVVAATRAAWRDGAACVLLLSLAFPVMHLAYGTGFLRGMVDFLLRRRDGVVDAAMVPLTR